jgi:hypothetical protein
MKKIMSGLAIAAIASTAFVGAVAAQTDTASGGNGGVSTSNATRRRRDGRLDHTVAAVAARPAMAASAAQH